MIKSSNTRKFSKEFFSILYFTKYECSEFSGISYIGSVANTLLPGRRNVKDKGIIFPELIPSNSPSLLHLSLFLHCQIVVILC